MAAGIATSQDFKAYLLPLVKESIGIEYKQLNPVLPMIAKVMTTDKALDIVQELVGIGMANRLEEGGVISFESHRQGRNRTYASTEFAKGMAITRRAIDDGQAIDHISIMSKQLVKALFHRKETEGAAFFNNPTSTSDPYAGMDALALLSTAHVLGNGATYANKPTVDGPLAEKILEDAMVNVWNFIGNDGTRINADVKNLVIPPALHFVASRLLGGSERPGTAERDINVLNKEGRLQDPIMWRFLTSSTAWFLLTDMEGFKLYQRAQPDLHSYNEEATRSIVYQIIERFVVNYDDSHFVYGSVGA